MPRMEIKATQVEDIVLSEISQEKTGLYDSTYTRFPEWLKP